MSSPDCRGAERRDGQHAPGASGFAEHAVRFACGEATLIGVVSVPEAASATGVVIVVGGPQVRAGSHRQFVLLARSLAAAGHAVLRFDVRGMGDSGGEPRTFEQLTDDIAAGIDCLQRHCAAVQRVALWGLCDGASAALLYWHDTRDSRVRGLCLANPWVRSDASLAVAQVKHYYAQRLLQPAFWAKLASGRVAVTAQAEFMQKLRLAFARPAAGALVDAPADAPADTPTDAPADAPTPHRPYPQRMAEAWRRFDGSVLLLVSGADLTAKEFLEHAARDAAWSGALSRPRLTRHDLPGADHTFSDAASRRAAEAATVDWIAHENVC